MLTLTPNRSVVVTFDPPETIQAEPFFAKARTRFEIREPILTNVEQLASGVWILKPEGTALHMLHETSSGQLKALRLSEFSAPSVLTEIPMQRSLTELTGVSPGVNVSASGDHFYLKRIPAATTWNQLIASPFSAPALPTTANYPLDAVLEQKTAPRPSDQGYVLRWIHPAHPQQYIDYVLSFRFGGPLTASGYGLFEIVFGGDGRAFLFEWISGAWSLVDQWRYAASEVVPGQPHTVRIIPHAARYLEIRTNVTDRAVPGLLFVNNRLNAFSGKSAALDAHVYEVKNRGSLPPLPGGLSYPVTGGGPPAFRVRRDVVLRWQLALVSYPASGTLRDQAFTVRSVDTSTHMLSVRRFSMVVYDPLTLLPKGATSAAAFNALTGAALSAGSENWSFRGTTYPLNGFTLPGAPNAIQVEITLTNNDGAGGTYSPWFFGYEARKVGETATPSLTALMIDSSHFRQSPVTRISTTGPDSDPSHESAHVVIRDLVNRCPRLRTRGEGKLRITSSYDAADASKLTVLFDGYWIKNESRLRGKAGVDYPSPSWTDYELTCLGQWKRLHERDFLATEIMSFAQDLDTATPPIAGTIPPWKVTDAIRFLFVAAGIPETQLDIPDLPIRLYFNQAGGEDVIQVQPGTNCAEFARKLAEDYLGYFLAWDACAGSAGMWRAKPVPRGDETPVWRFVKSGPGPGRLVTHLPAYGTDASFIARDTLNEWTVPPEGNWLRVTGEVDGRVYACTARNPKSYNRPGETTADVDHPDYLGRFRPIFRRHDPTLLTRPAVQFVTRRVFDIACRAQRFARFQTPMPLIDAAAAEPSIYTTYQRRPLMFGDVVEVGTPSSGFTKYMVRQCNLVMKKQHHQLAQIELTRFNDPLPA